jgi:protein-disulfide isomerase
MKRIVGSLCIAVLGLAACQKEDVTLHKKIDDLAAKVDALDKKIGQGPAPGAARPQAQRPPGPDPTAVYAVPIDGAPFEGPQHAKVTIVKAFEFACPFCERVRPTIEQIEKDYGNDVKVVYKNFVVHPQTATDPALASCAAHRQGKYKEMKELLWEKAYKANRNFARDNLEALGLDMAKYKADMDGACKEIIQKEQKELSAVGVRGTPAFYINGRYLSGAQPIDRFKAVIDEELKKANDAVSKGTSVDAYYSEAVLKKGKKSL